MLTEFCFAFADNGLIVNILPQQNRIDSLSADQASEYTGESIMI